MGSGRPLTLSVLQNLLQNTLQSVMCSTSIAFANTASATSPPISPNPSLPHKPLQPPAGLGTRVGPARHGHSLGEDEDPGSLETHGGPSAQHRPGAHTPGPGPPGLLPWGWAATYLGGEVLGQNFLPFFAQLFIWSNFIFCLKRKEEKNSERFAHEPRGVTEPLGPQEETPWSGPSPPSGQGAEAPGAGGPPPHPACSAPAWTRPGQRLPSGLHVRTPGEPAWCPGLTRPTPVRPSGDKGRASRRPRLRCQEAGLRTTGADKSKEVTGR